MDDDEPIVNSVDTTSFLLKDVTLIKGENTEDGFDLLVKDGVITQISKDIPAASHTGYQEISGEGKYVIPALCDMHTHATHPNDLFLYVANGVTTVRNMWGSETLLKTREKIKSGELIGPHMYIASPGFEQPPSYWHNAVLIQDPNKIYSQVKSQKDKGYDYIKIYENLSLENYQLIHQYAASLDIPLVGHIPMGVTIDYVLDQETQRSIEHMDSYLESINVNGTSINNPMTYQVDEGKMNSLVEKTVAADVWNCPTITISTRHIGQASALQSNPELDYVSPQMRSWYSSSGGRLNYWNADGYTRHKLRLIKRLYDAGAKMILGTDTGLRYILPGYSVHEELELFVRAGISPHDALKMATEHCAEFLGREDQGKIEVGMRAELVLLNKNPLEDISATKDIYGVMTSGRWLSHDDIAKKLEEIRASYN